MTLTRTVGAALRLVGRLRTALYAAGDGRAGERPQSLQKNGMLQALRRSVRAVAHDSLDELPWWEKVEDVVMEFFSEICEQRKFRQETAYRAMQLFQRMVAQVCSRETVALHAAACFLLANKFDEDDYVYPGDLADGVPCTLAELLGAEKVVLDTLNWEVYSPSAQQFVDVLADEEHHSAAAAFVDKHWRGSRMRHMSAEELARFAIFATNQTPRTAARKRTRSSGSQPPSEEPVQTCSRQRTF